MRVLAVIAALTLLPSIVAAEEITLRDLHEGGVLTIQSEVQPCSDWAADFDNKEPQGIDTYQGFKKFYWVRNWGNRHDWRLYQSLGGHSLVVKKNFETEECIMQLFGLRP